MRLTLPNTDSGEPWTLSVVPRLKKSWGYCDVKQRRIVITKAAQREGISREILLHEAIHKLMWFLDEEAVDYMAKELDATLDAAEDAGILEL